MIGFLLVRWWISSGSTWTHTCHSWGRKRLKCWWWTTWPSWCVCVLISPRKILDVRDFVHCIIQVLKLKCFNKMVNCRQVKIDMEQTVSTQHWQRRGKYYGYKIGWLLYLMVSLGDTKAANPNVKTCGPSPNPHVGDKVEKKMSRW